ncbi:bifunctional helix-turn-helix transcriptional regulator/GNAT family N-acetyltransferase [Anaeromyxobacter diazotrophicus]|uniref:GNAT family N-acetyltransferase n=1 Tax=Anaeromyxobacter diazotrophicus TaxID=2590199 RepID=A0A7I9VN08_9BACT|nr:helix-turn-helix domain-containing GNAT family N-acetyltransferase [Anaeromyxobacter diazotrophicus]GEJ57510.1 GNAT family N-acetyltransferase [Anaeromyxobacter diazotrophicus]
MPTPDRLPAPSARRIEAVRNFNRFYTRRIGVLSEGLLHSEFTLTESRLLWELAHAESVTASELARRLDLDAGYLSRLLRGFGRRGLVKRTRSKGDGREVLLDLTAAGRRAFASLNARSEEEVGAMLAALPDGQQDHLIHSLSTIERLLDDAKGRAARAPYLLRAHQPGDIGWVVSRHGAIYAQEYRWDLTFEALVARIAADFIDRFEPSREACWIAERDGVNVGCVFLVQWRDEATQQPVEGVAQLRMLLVEPAARGLGIGARLVRECSRFARQAGYRSIRLWTNSVLTAARGIYQKEGYRLVASEPHRSFGQDLVGEIWELTLA